jgi:hypothetical protein
MRRRRFATLPTGPPTDDELDRVLWQLDGIRHGGHTLAESLAYLSHRADQEDQAQARRATGLTTTVGIDVGRRWGRGLLGRLLGR